jgi:hypothetical protein
MPAITAPARAAFPTLARSSFKALSWVVRGAVVEGAKAEADAIRASDVTANFIFLENKL